MNAPRSLFASFAVADLVRALDEVPLARALKLANVGPLHRPCCPRASCRGRIRIMGPSAWLCLKCCAMGGSGAYWVMAATGWTFDELHEAIEQAACVTLGVHEFLRAANG